MGQADEQNNFNLSTQGCRGILKLCSQCGNSCTHVSDRIPRSREREERRAGHARQGSRDGVAAVKDTTERERRTDRPSAVSRAREGGGGPLARSLARSRECRLPISNGTKKNCCCEERGSAGCERGKGAWVPALRKLFGHLRVSEIGNRLIHTFRSGM